MPDDADAVLDRIDPTGAKDFGLSPGSHATATPRAVPVEMTTSIVCPVCGAVAVQEKCKVVCRSEKCRGRVVMNCSEF